MVLLWNIVFDWYGMLNGLLDFFHLKGKDWMNTGAAFGVLVFSYIWKNLGYDVILWMAGLHGIPESILEAARIDGAGELQIFFRLGIPLGVSGIISAMVLSFLECWSMMEQSMTFLETKSLWPLSLFLPEIDGGNAGLSLCASFAALLPAIFVFLAGQDYLEQGIASSAVKE